MAWRAALAAPFVRYNDLLERRPILIKCLTSGAMYAGGDVLAQYAEHYNASQDPELAAALKPMAINWKRAAVFLVFGTCVGGPAYHYWFNYLNELPQVLWRLKQTRQRGRILRAYAYLKTHGIEVRLDPTKLPKSAPLGKWTGKIAKIAADQLIFSSLYTLVFFMSIGCMTGTADKAAATRVQLQIDEASEFLQNKYKLPDPLFEELLSRLRDHIEENEHVYSRRSRSLGKHLLGRESGAAAHEGEGHADHEVELHAELPEQWQIINDIYQRLLREREEMHYEEATWSDIWRHSWEHTKQVYLDTYIADCVLWPPLQLINFTFIPVRLQFLYVNTANLAWNTFLSFMANKHH